MVGEERYLLDEIRRRKNAWMERVLSGKGMLKTALEGRMLGKREKERNIIGFLDKMKGSWTYSKFMREGKAASILLKYSVQMYVVSRNFYNINT